MMNMNIIKNLHLSVRFLPRVNVSVRMFSESCSLCQRQSQFKNIKKNKSRKKYRQYTPSTDINSSESELSAKFQEYVENLILGSHEEMKTVTEKERLLTSSLPDSVLELRGLCINNLELDSDYIVTSDEGFHVKLVRAGGVSLPSGGWRSGTLVTVVLDDTGGWSQDHHESWRRVDGIIVDISSERIIVSVDNVSSWLLEMFHGRLGQRSIKLLKRSEEQIYRNSIKQLKHLLQHPVQFDKVPPARFIFENILEVSDKQDATADVPEQVLTVFNKRVLRDESKRSALLTCAQCPPLHIIQGPPGTGKTTTLASAVLSSVSNGDTCLVVTPSHAACDAAARALTQHWPGYTAGSLVRLGHKLRLTDRSVEQYLPEQIVTSEHLESLRSQLAWVRRQLVETSSESGDMLREERSLVSQVRQEYRELEERVVKSARVVVCTLQTAMRWWILRLVETGHFSVVYVDEAGFSLDSHLLPVLVRAGRLVLAGDHCQLPPVVLSDQGQERGLGVSLMERVSNVCPGVVTLLTTQYRSHHIISGQFIFKYIF